MYENLLEMTTINARQDSHAFQLGTSLNVPSYESTNPSKIMTEAHDSMEQMTTFNLYSSLLAINLEDTYEFTSLLFSPSQQRIEPSENTNNPQFPQNFLLWSNSIHICWEWEVKSQIQWKNQGQDKILIEIPQCHCKYRWKTSNNPC